MNTLFSLLQMMCWKVSSPQESDRRSVRKVKDAVSAGTFNSINFAMREFLYYRALFERFYDQVLLWGRIEALCAGIIPIFIWFRMQPRIYGSNDKPRNVTFSHKNVKCATVAWASRGQSA